MDFASNEQKTAEGQMRLLFVNNLQIPAAERLSTKQALVARRHQYKAVMRSIYSELALSKHPVGSTDRKDVDHGDIGQHQQLYD